MANECIFHNDFMKTVNSDINMLKENIEDINNNFDKLFNQVSSLDKKIDKFGSIDIINGGGLKVKVSFNEIIPNLYNVTKDLRLIVENNQNKMYKLFDDYKMTPDKLMEMAEEKLPELIIKADEIRSEKIDKKINKSNKFFEFVLNGGKILFYVVVGFYFILQILQKKVI